MPELVTHYMVSLLLSSRVMSLRHALLLALVGLLPDVDVLFRIHRWFTHSLVLALITFIVVYLVISVVKSEVLKYLITAYIIYVIHIVLDVFTAPTPIFWPLTPTSYMLKVGLDGFISVRGLTVTPNVVLYMRPVDFTQKAVIEGPIISEYGIMTALVVITTIVVERLRGLRR